MKREDIEHLATLARIRLSADEKDRLPQELSSIMSYVSVVSDIAADKVDDTPEVGARSNVFREDEVTNKPEQFSDDIIAEMPSTQGRYLSVKKILQIDD